jgi:hypothetical protein
MNKSGLSTYTEMLRSALIPFRDLEFFTSSSKPLAINIIPRPASKVRISLAGMGALNLTGVEIVGVAEAGSENAPVIGEADLTTLHRPDVPQRVQLRKWDGASGPGLVEVARAGNPWAILDLGGIHDVSRIQLWTAAMPRQAWAPLLVETSVDGVAWETVYSTSARLSAFAEVWASIGASGAISAEDPRAWDLFTEIVTLVVTGQRGEAKKRLKASRLPSDVLADIRGAVAKQILEPMHLDWNHHGIRRTFRYWTTREKVRYIRTANHLIDRIAKELSPYVCLGFGSVLSLVRDQDLIPHDDDLDIILAFDRDECRTISEGFDRVVEFAAREGYKVREPFAKSHRQLIRSGAKKVDVFVSLKEGDRVSWFPQRRGSLAVSDVFPPIRASMLGVECLVPRNPLKYLESVYGPNWRKPDPNFSHNWRTREYDEIW